MSIDIIAATRSGAEFEAAKILQGWFRSYLGAEDKVIIVVGAKTEGERVEDIDLLVIGELAPGRMIPEASLPETMAGRSAELRDFVFTIEVKAHDPRNIQVVSGNNIQVRYADDWKSATDQSNEQKYALKNWVERRLKLTCPRISHAVWLINVASAELQPAPRHVLFRDSGLPDLLRLLDARMLERAAERENRAPVVTSIVGRDRSVMAQLQVYFRSRTELGVLDRRKLERICERIVRDQNWTDRLGQQLLVFRGRGGAGKTLRLLNLARYLHNVRGQRVLFLTYNRALVQDVRRLTNVLGLSPDQVHIQTTASFMLKLCKAMDLSPLKADGSMDWSAFAELKADAARQLKVLSRTEIRESANAEAHPDVFKWDTVLIDEGQDWPLADKSAVLSIFGHQSVIVADGVDQFVQGVEHCDWTAGVPTSERQIVSLPKSLRLKANLCRFAMAFAAEMNLPDWSIDLDPELSGGKVKLFLRPYGRVDHEALFAEHAAAGNAPIDALFCISKSHRSVHKALPGMLADWDLRVWDGTESANLSHYPSNINQHRIVQYQSCRGLEGWTVVCLDLDRFFEEQLKHAPVSPAPDLLIDRETLARRHAARWCLIPFTRAIDTLAVHASETSELGQKLLNVARRFPDFVDIIRD